MSAKIICFILPLLSVILFSVGDVHQVPLQGPVIIDTDASIDDATALLMTLGYTNLKVEAITCVRGHTDVVNAAINVQKVLNVAKKPDIPLHIGSDFGLVHQQKTGHYYGKDGFGDIDDNSQLKMVNLAKGHAAVAMTNLVTQNPGKITIMCLGPLTNLALACHIQPQFLKLVKLVIILGGTMVGFGDAVPGVEFNFHMDPEAVAFVLNRALVTSSPIMMMPVEAFKSQRPITKDWRWNVLGKLNSPAVTFLNRIQAKCDELEKKHPDRSPIIYNAYDVFLPIILMKPSYILQATDYYATVDSSGTTAKGSLVVDVYNLTRNRANVIVVGKVDTELTKECLVRYLS